jgi:hypothetical protein
VIDPLHVLYLRLICCQHLGMALLSFAAPTHLSPLQQKQHAVQILAVRRKLKKSIKSKIPIKIKKILTKINQ